MNWTRSLYWRIAIGVVAVLAAMLVVQAVLFVWVMAQLGRTLPGQSPARFAQTIAMDVSNALQREPELDLAHYLDEQYAQYTHPFFVMLIDGRLITIGAAPSESLVQSTRTLLQRRAHVFPGPNRSGQGRGRDPSPPGPDDPELALGLSRPMPIVINGRVAGMVVVPNRAPFTFLLTRFAPMLGVVAGIVLIVGAILTSVLTFGPPHRRLRGLETAARRLGTGDLSTRAPERGGDEIAAVASAFNSMATDMAARAEALAASDRTRRQLLADVLHELNTPITAMRGYLETLRMSDIPLDAETRDRYLSIVSDEMGRLEQLIGDLLDLARLEGGGTALRIDDVPVAQLFARVAARHERACQLGGVTFVESIAPGAETVRGGRDRLEQALQNLAANAMRYVPAGSTLRLTSLVEHDAITLKVEDEGAGIAAEHMPHIFDRFYKADASRHETAGSGLGLSIVKAIVEQHGGRISARSQPGHTVFEISGLPKG